MPLPAEDDYFERRNAAYNALWAFFRAEGVAAVFMTDRRGDGGLLFAESVNGWVPKTPFPPPVIVVAPEAYGRMARLVEKKTPVKVQVDLQVRYYEDTPDGFNVIAEIPGGRKKDEVVMLGAHLDSWHAGTGATDNAAGSAVVLEAFRILKALNLPMDRTVRLALWSGEEQGLLGSEGYVKSHFGDTMTMALKPEQSKVSAYFNLDNGTGKIRGIYLQGNDMARPIFEQWFNPFHDQGAKAVTIRNTGGTDHQSFDGIGIPGFQFIQDPLDYSTAHAPLEPRHLRPLAGWRLDAGVGNSGLVRLPGGDAPGAHSEKSPPEANATEKSRTRSSSLSGVGFTRAKRAGLHRSATGKEWFSNERGEDSAEPARSALTRENHHGNFCSG